MAATPKERAGLMEQLSTGMAVKCETVTASPTMMGAIVAMCLFVSARAESVAAMTVMTSRKVQPNSTPSASVAFALLLISFAPPSTLSKSAGVMMRTRPAPQMAPRHCATV